MDIYYLRISTAECPCMDIPAWISMFISTLLGTDIQKSWISMLIFVVFWKSIYEYAMDYRTRDSGHQQMHTLTCHSFHLSWSPHTLWVYHEYSLNLCRSRKGSARVYSDYWSEIAAKTSTCSTRQNGYFQTSHDNANSREPDCNVP